MSNQGWIKLHRKVLDNEFSSGSCERMGFWINLLLMVNHKDNSFYIGSSRVTVKAGQFLTGRKQLSKIMHVSEMKCERWLSCLEIAQQIEQQKTNKYRVITIRKWGSYQQDEQENAQLVNNKRTTDEQQMNTNKNDKNVENDINITNVMDKSDVFAKRYGNADVNTVLARLSSLSPTGKLDGTDTDNRRMAHNLIRLYTLKVVLQSISNIPGSFYEGKITSVRKLKNSLNALLISETKGGIASI